MLQSIFKQLTSICSKSNDAFEVFHGHFPQCTAYTAGSANILNSMTFETAIVKVLKGHEVELTTAEKNTLVKFEKAPSDIVLESVDIQSDLNNSALRRQNASRYIDLSCIPGTSNDCERLFSAVRQTICEHRFGLTAGSLERQLFLHYNRSFWNTKTLGKVIRTKKSAEVVVIL
ncbi:hypothetical protein GEMRC1_005086 [Eukaryota sp. GEM-RC1]